MNILRWVTARNRLGDDSNDVEGSGRRTEEERERRLQELQLNLLYPEDEHQNLPKRTGNQRLQVKVDNQALDGRGDAVVLACEAPAPHSQSEQLSELLRPADRAPQKTTASGLLNALRQLFDDDSDCSDVEAKPRNNQHDEEALSRVRKLELNLLYPEIDDVGVAEAPLPPPAPLPVPRASAWTGEEMPMAGPLLEAVPMPRASASRPPANTRRGRRLDTVLAEPLVRKSALADLVWLGVPEEGQRSEAWQMLLGYRPLALTQRDATLYAKRCEYQELRCGIYEGSTCSSKSGGEEEADALRQIRCDLPRTEICKGEGMSAIQAIVDCELVQALMERVLFVWSMQQPAAGYVQGMNDVLLPLLYVFLVERASCDSADVELCAAFVESLPAAVLDEIEADCYWCLKSVLSEVLDHYIPGQPGLQRAVDLLTSQLRDIDEPLVENLELQGADLKVVAFRWLGCLMVRELPMPLCARLWDTCIAESALGQRKGFSDFLIGFFASFLSSHRKTLRTAPFEDIMGFLLRPPISHISIQQLEILLSETFVLSSNMSKYLQPTSATAMAVPAALELVPENIALAQYVPPEVAEPQASGAHPTSKQLTIRYGMGSEQNLHAADCPPYSSTVRQELAVQVAPSTHTPKSYSHKSSVGSMSTSALHTSAGASLLSSTGSLCSGSQAGEDFEASEVGELCTELPHEEMLEPEDRIRADEAVDTLTSGGLFVV